MRLCWFVCIYIYIQSPVWFGDRPEEVTYLSVRSSSWSISGPIARHCSANTTLGLLSRPDILNHNYGRIITVKLKKWMQVVGRGVELVVGGERV